MSKNRVIWNFALFLIALISLPIAYAQTFAGSRIYFILINAAVIGVVLFLLQAVLLPGKPDKERVSAWVIVIVASLVIAYLYGQNDFIWRSGPLAGFFSIYVLVNSIIIGAVLYFLLGLLPIGKNLKSPEGNIGYGLLIFLVALIFAVKIGNKWVWQQETIRILGNYLFGPQGILNPNWGLWTFIGASVLLTFFFNGFLLRDQKGLVNYAMAILIASSMASSGVSIRSVIIMGEIIFTIVLAYAMGANASKEGLTNPRWLLAILLVGWASAAATYGTEYQGILAWFIGNILYWMGLLSAPTTAAGATAAAAPSGWSWKWIIGALVFLALLFGGGIATASAGGWGLWAVLGVLALLIFLVPGVGLGAFIILGIVILILFVILRGENRQRVLTLSWGEIKKRINAIWKSTNYTRDATKGREPQFFRENRLLFHALANYTTRSEITYRYWAVVKDAAKMWQKMEPVLKEFLDREKLRMDIIVFRQGGILSNGEKIEGWNKLNVEVVELINEFYRLLVRTQVSAKFGLKAPDQYELETGELSKLSERALRLANRIKEIHGLYKVRLNAYGAHYALKGYRDIILNMSNVTGDVLEHQEKFARIGAKFQMGDQVPKSRDPINGKDEVAGKDPEGLPIIEVNQYGEVVADISEQRDSFGKLPDPRRYNRPRKVGPNDIIDYPHFAKWVDNIEKDWKALAYDIRYGTYHPFSRTHPAYIKAFGEKIYPEFEDNKIPFTNSPSKGSDWAVDMRALADPGLNKYWGRKSFHDFEPPFVNPFPIMSSLGLGKYLFEAAQLDMTDKELAKEHLNKWFKDSGVEEKNLPGKFPVYSKLGEDVKLGGGGEH